MSALFRFVILVAIRDRLLLVLLVMMAAGAAMGHFVGVITMAEESRVSAVLVAGSLRLILIVGLIVFVAQLCQRLFETKELEAFLSRPVTRGGFAFAFWAGLAALGLFLTVAVTGIVALFVRQPGGADLWIWGASLALEMAMMVAVALFAGLILTRAVAATLFSLAVYVFARSTGFLTAELGSFQEILAAPPADLVLQGMLKILSFIVPRLDLHAPSAWLVHGVPDPASALGWQAVSTTVYVVLILAAATADLRHKSL